MFRPLREPMVGVNRCVVSLCILVPELSVRNLCRAERLTALSVIALFEATKDYLGNQLVKPGWYRVIFIHTPDLKKSGVFFYAPPHIYT